MALPSTVTVPVVVDDIGFISRWTRFSDCSLPEVLAVSADPLALDGGAAKAAPLHSSKDARATARRLTFMEGSPAGLDDARRFARIGSPQYGPARWHVHTPQVMHSRRRGW